MESRISKDPKYQEDIIKVLRRTDKCVNPRAAVTAYLFRLATPQALERFNWEGTGRLKRLSFEKEAPKIYKIMGQVLYERFKKLYDETDANRDADLRKYVVSKLKTNGFKYHGEYRRNTSRSATVSDESDDGNEGEEQASTDDEQQDAEMESNDEIYSDNDSCSSENLLEKGLGLNTGSEEQLSVLNPNAYL